MTNKESDPNQNARRIRFKIDFPRVFPNLRSFYYELGLLDIRIG
ncbi:hypothetical protein LEP1GSC192_3668 [Leptospira sp. B5-022]|nr:hypothetical protein LEP1GSC192_3668 [Leptospira sp. B5-022]